MKKFIFILFFAFNCYSQSHNLPNSCLINSIIAYEDIRRSFHDKNVWGNILVYKIIHPRNSRFFLGHAVSIFYWNNTYYVYDINQGSFELNTKDLGLKTNPLKAARLIEYKNKVIDAEYLIKN
jgi:hypothetical protein